MKFFVPPGAATLAEVGDTPTEIVAAPAMVIMAAADFDTSVTEVAVSVTVEGDGMVAGAVYVIAIPDGLAGAESRPHPEPVQPAPDKVHVTPLFCISFATVAVNCAVAEVCTAALVAFRRKATGEGDCGSELEGELAQPPSSKASAASDVMARKELRQGTLDMSGKPRVGRCRITFWCILHPTIHCGIDVGKL